MLYTFEVIQYGERYGDSVQVFAPNELQAYALVAQDYPRHVSIERVA